LRKNTPRKKKRQAKNVEILPPDPRVLAKFTSPGNEIPTSRDPSLSLTVRVFERETELKGAFKKEFALQVEELFACPNPDCGFRYVAKAGDSDPTIRMLVHHYLHLAREADPRVQIVALNRMAEILDPPRERVTSGLLESGVLTPEEKKLLKLTSREIEEIG
jgi:hypothetical protein